MDYLFLALLVYCLMALVFYGWGQLLTSTLKLNDRQDHQPILKVWLGWATTLVCLQLLRFFFPIQAPQVIFVTLLGIAGCGLGVQQYLKDKEGGREKVKALLSPQTIMVIILLCGIALWLAGKGMLSPVNYDTGLYHLHSIRWINEYPMVPGLGNLHNRLAFNQSFFTYVAALNFYPYFDHGRSFANSFLMLLSFATFLPSLLLLLRHPSAMLTRLSIGHISDIFLLMVLFYYILSNDGLASPTPDLCSHILQLILFSLFIHGYQKWRNGSREMGLKPITIILLGITAITVKLSNLVLCCSLIFMATLYIFSARPKPLQEFLRIMILPLIAVSAWLFHGYYLSGAPLFPSTAIYFQREWSMPVQHIERMYNLILSWGRFPGEDYQNVLGNSDWIVPWFERLEKYDGKKWVVIIPFYTGLFFMVCSILYQSIKGKFWRTPDVHLYLPVAASILFWFSTAPSVRFAESLIALFSLSSGLSFLLLLEKHKGKMIYKASTLLILITLCFPYSQYIYNNRKSLNTISTSGWQPIPTVPLLEHKISSDVTLYSPGKGGQSWDAPLPCTTRFQDYIRLLRDNDLSAGFYSELKEESLQ